MTELYGVSQFQDTETSMVAAMHHKFGFDIGTEPQLLTPELSQERYEKMLEELEEFKEAFEAGDLALAADALIDLGVFMKGTAVMMGLPWGPLFEDVQRANMDKEVGVAPNRPDHKQDMIKPEGWEGPKTQEILDRAKQS